MIALTDGLPFVQFDSGRMVKFERGWLVHSLAQAAQNAGYQKWWLAEHVAESVTSYLALQCNENIITVPRLVSAVQCALQVIGYGEVAAHFSPAPPPAHISLVELAREAGAGYELAFFDMLSRRIHEALRESSCYVDLFGLEPCVKQLRAKKVWSRDCDALRTEIVTFVREQLSAAGTANEPLFSLA